MQTKFTKTLLAALPMAGLLFTAPAVFAHDDDYNHGRWNNRQERHDDYLRRDHRDFHGDRQDWRWGGQGWDRRDRNSNWDWHRRNNDRDWSWSRGRDNWRSRYNNNDCPPTSNNWWYR